MNYHDVHTLAMGLGVPGVPARDGQADNGGVMIALLFGALLILFLLMNQRRGE